MIYAVLLAAAAAAVLIPALTAKKRQTASLRRECRGHMRFSPPNPDAAVDRHIRNLKERYPGKTEKWYLEKILNDLERDRR